MASAGPWGFDQSFTDPSFADHNCTITFSKDVKDQIRAAQKRSAAAKVPKSREAKLVTLRDIERTPDRTFNRIQGPRAQGPPHAYLSEYMGSYGGHPRYKPLWGSWGSLKVAGPYLEKASPLFNPSVAQATGPGRWKTTRSLPKHEVER